MISNHLSMVEQLRPVSNELAAQVAQYLAMGGSIEAVDTRRSLYNPIPFNSEALTPTSKRSTDTAADNGSEVTKRNSAIKAANAAKKKAFENEVARKLEPLLEIGVVEAAKKLCMSQSRLNRIATTNGLVFARSHAAERAMDAKLAPRVRELCNQGIGQVEIAELLGIRRGRVRRIALDYKLRFGSRTKIEDEVVIVEKIRALLPSGCTRKKASEQIGISQKVLTRIVEQYDIDFPARITKPRKE